jgi:hypothetical protein
MSTVKAVYKGKVNDHFTSIMLERNELELELHHMLVWILLHQNEAMNLLHAYHSVRDAAEARQDNTKR